MLQLLVTGTLLGLASGITPGPLQALVIAESARNGWRQGVAAALAPLVTDALIISATVWLFSHVSGLVLHVMTLIGALMVGYIAYDTWRAQSQLIGNADAPPSVHHPEALSEVANGDGSAVPADVGPTEVAAATMTQAPLAKALPVQRAVDKPAVDKPKPAGDKPTGQLRTLLQAALLNILNPHAWLFWIVIGSPLVVKSAKTSLLDAATFIFFFYLFLVGTKVVLAAGIDRGLSMSGGRGRIWILRGTSIALLILAVVMLVTTLLGLYH